MSVNFHELIEGFHNFKESYLLKEHEFFDRLAHGQSPKTLVIACCDSRADPAILMGCRPGDLFVVRSIAALVPGAQDAGDPDCGGIQGALFPHKIADEKWISRWVSLAHPVAEEIRREEPSGETELLARRTEEGAVLLSLENLLSYAWVREKVESGALSLHALYYDMKAKTMNIWNAEREDFEPIVPV